MTHRLLTLIMALAMLLVACAPTQVTPSESFSGSIVTGDVPIGAVWSLTGAGAVYGSSQQKAADLAVQEINGSGRLGQAKLKLTTEDDRSTKEGAIAAFQKLLNRDKVVAIVGPTLSNSALAADPLAQEKKVVVLGVSNTAGGITEMGNYVFRDSLPESAVIPNTVKVTKDKFGYKKVAVLYGDDDAFTKSGYDVFEKALADNGVTILTTETFKKGDTDFSAQLTKIKALSPDAIVVSALAEEAAGIMSQGRQLGIPATVPFIGGNGFNSPQLARLAGPAAEGSISGAAWFISADTQANTTFVNAFKARYNADPDQFAAQAYSGVYLLAQAVKRAGSSDATAIREALAKTSNADVPLGTFSFTDQREPVHPPVVQIVKNGKFELFK
jgi:branched-chain amino acid transport system substrate-binding protein